MFDRCDADTMAVVEAALDEARRLGHNYLGTEHLLVALVRRPDVLPHGVAALLPPETAVVEAFRAVFARPPADDATLLANIGIDLEAVRSAVRQSFGDDAIERLGRRRVHQRREASASPSTPTAFLPTRRLRVDTCVIEA